MLHYSFGQTVSQTQHERNIVCYVEAKHVAAHNVNLVFGVAVSVRYKSVSSHSQRQLAASGVQLQPIACGFLPCNAHASCGTYGLEHSLSVSSRS